MYCGGARRRRLMFIMGTFQFMHLKKAQITLQPALRISGGKIGGNLLLHKSQHCTMKGPPFFSLCPRMPLLLIAPWKHWCCVHCVELTVSIEIYCLFVIALLLWLVIVYGCPDLRQPQKGATVFLLLLLLLWMSAIHLICSLGFWKLGDILKLQG